MSDGAQIVNLGDAEVAEHRLSEAFRGRIAQLGTRLGARKLGCSLVVLEPGQKPWPYHLHHVNEEMYVVLDGEGLFRLDGRTHRLRKGDLVCIPPGSGSAHQIVNDSAAELRYLAISTMEEPELNEFPDSGKVRFLAGSPPGGDKTARTVDLTARLDDAVDYLDDEE